MAIVIQLSFVTLIEALFSQFSGDEQKSLTSMRKMVSSWTASANTGEEEELLSKAQPRMEPSVAHKLLPEPSMKSKAVIGPMLPSMMVCTSKIFVVYWYCS